MPDGLACVVPATRKVGKKKEKVFVFLLFNLREAKLLLLEVPDIETNVWRGKKN